MKYACLVYVDRKLVSALTPEQNRKLINDSIDFDWDVKERGHLLLAQPLDEPETAITIRTRSGRLSSTDGPFAETKELIAGFWLWECKSLAEAIEWVKRAPNPHNEDSDIEVRQVFETEDFGDRLSPELRAQEERLRAQAAKR